MRFYLSHDIEIAGNAAHRRRLTFAAKFLPGAIVDTCGNLDTKRMHRAHTAGAAAAWSNHDFTKALGSVLGRPTFLAVPSFGPKLLLGSELAQGLLFSSARVLPEVATTHGYQFAHRTVEDALAALLDR